MTEAKTLESANARSHQTNMVKDFEPPSAPGHFPSFEVFDPLTDPDFQAGMASLAALIEFVRIAPNSRTSAVVRRVIRSAVSEVHFIRIFDMGRLDEKNMRHALNVIHAAARTPGEFSAWAYRHHSPDLVQVALDSDADFREQVKALLAN